MHRSVLAIIAFTIAVGVAGLPVRADHPFRDDAPHIVTIAGGGTPETDEAGRTGTETFLGTRAFLDGPQGLALDAAAGKLLIADQVHHRILGPLVGGRFASGDGIFSADGTEPPAIQANPPHPFLLECEGPTGASPRPA